MKLQRTLSIIKPDATERNITGQVNAMLEGAGLRIVAQKRVVLTQAQAEGFYAEHAARPFFSELVEFMVSGPVVLQVLEGQNAVQRNRDIMGATNPKEAEKGTIRAEHGRSLGENSVHGSDSTESAKREIAYFFDADSIPG